MKKRAQTWDTVIPWLIGFGVLALVILAYFGISGKLGNIGEFFRNLLRFGK